MVSYTFCPWTGKGGLPPPPHTPATLTKEATSPTMLLSGPPLILLSLLAQQVTTGALAVVSLVGVHTVQAG